MQHFGNFFRSLRSARGWTQENAAAEAKLSTRTIGAIEGNSVLMMHASTQRLVLQALDRARPLTADELAQWAAAAGTTLPALARAAAIDVPPGEPSNIEVIGPGPRPTVKLPGDTPDRGLRLASALALALRHGSPAEVASVLEGWAAIRPPVEDAGGVEGTLKIEIGVVGEGDAARDVSIYAPVDRQAAPQIDPPPQRATRKQG